MLVRRRYTRLCGIPATLPGEDAAVLRVPGQALRDMLANLTREDAWVFLRTNKEPSSAWHIPMEEIERFCIEQPENPGCVPIPRGFGRERFVLHLFAGRRRRGDFQFYMDVLTDLHGDYQIRVISVDIVINRIWGDLGHPKTRRFWIQATLDGQVVGLMGGPPCETWSRARARQWKPDSSGGRAGPRVIRTLTETWGMAGIAFTQRVGTDQDWEHGFPAGGDGGPCRDWWHRSTGASCSTTATDSCVHLEDSHHADASAP